MVCFCAEAVVGDAGKIQAENTGEREGAAEVEGGCGDSQGEFAIEKAIARPVRCFLYIVNVSVSGIKELINM